MTTTIDFWSPAPSSGRFDKTALIEHALALAGKNLSGNWSVKQLKDATALARTNLAIRRKSINNSTPIVPNGEGAGGGPAGRAQPKATHYYDPTTGTIKPVGQ